MSDAKTGLITVILASLAVICFAWKASLDMALMEQKNQRLSQENRELEIKLDYYQRGVNDSQ
jgi:Tfp pilus assembly protein PilO